MKHLLIALAMTIAHTALAQDLYLNCGERQIPCDNGNKDHFAMMSPCPYQDIDSINIPTAILDSARQYLLERVGAHFYSRLKFYSCQTVDFKKYREIKKEKPFIDKKSANKKVKYGIQYYFTVQDSMRYYLSLIYDKNGKLISGHFLPDSKTNRDFDKIVDVCKATQVAEADSIFSGKVEEIFLEYLPNVNSFVWVAQKPNTREEKNVIVSRFIVINANTGQIIKRHTAKGRMVCEFPSF